MAKQATSNPSFLEAVRGGIVVTVRVIPRASKTVVAGVRDGALLVRLAAPPVDGAANAALVELLAGILHTARRQVSVIGGAQHRHKRVQVLGVDVESAARAIAVDPR
jgi:uncharacterized protein (TIGR00251 family)